MTDSLDLHFLRTARSRDVALHLRKTALDQQHSNANTTHQLLEAIKSESLPPMVYALWTSSCPDHSATVAGMQQSHSIIVRSSAIRNFRRRFRTSDFEGLWRALGGTDGIVMLISQFSVIHVKEFCKAVARCSTSKSDAQRRQALVTNLLRTLTNETVKPNPDDRYLLALYAKMIYACTTDFKDAWISRQDNSDLDMAKLFETDVDLYRGQCLKSLASCNGALDGGFAKYSPLFLSIPQAPDDSDPSISASMAFAFKMLKSIQDFGIVPEDANWLYDTIRSLLRRLARRKASPKFTLECLDAMGYCALNKCPGAKYIKVQREPLDRRYCLDLIKLWQRGPTLYEPKLGPLLRDINFHWKTIPSVRREERYKLLRWISAEHAGIDIEDDSQLKGRTIFTHLQGQLMLSLPNAEAVRLFDRCESVRPMSGWPGLSMLGIDKLDEAGAQIPVELSRLHILDDADEARLEGRVRTMHCREMSEKTGSQPIRSAWITAALYFAVASKSLDLLQNTVIWARRFSRDPKTALELYGAHPRAPVFRDERTITFLSAIPANLPKSTTLASISRNVRKGNEILLDLLISPVLVQNDAAFKRNHWDKVFSLPKDIVYSRLEHVNALQSRLGLTDEQIFSSIWRDTLTMLLRAEEMGLADGNATLQYNAIEGPFKLDTKVMYRDENPIKCPSTATLRFIDELAVRRDSLWTFHRTHQHPEVTSLGPPWPRGLPIQAHWIPDDAMIPHHKDNAKEKVQEQRHWVSKLAGHLPFLERRVKEIIFMHPEQALRPAPSDKEMQSAIGPFIDSFGFALQRYLSWCHPTESQKRLEAAWTYATSALSGDRMSALETGHLWKKTFSVAGAGLTASMLEGPSHSDPQLPSQEFHATDAVEWQPDPEANLIGGRPRRLNALLIDCLLSPSSSFEKPLIRPVSISSFWNLERYTRVRIPRNKSKKGAVTIDVPNKAREAFIAAVLLLIDGRTQAGTNLLEQPFPSTSTPRFPAIFLDAGTIDSKVPSDDDVERILERFLPAIPSSLLTRLAEGLIERSLGGSTPSKTLRQWTSFVLGLLVMSDKPGFAKDLIVRIVLDTPGETPWHRILLHSGVLKRMPSSHVKDLVSSLTDGIAQRLAQQQEEISADEDVSNTDPAVAPGPYTPNKPAVKVTTVKMLTQILRNASFLGDDFILHALLRLFETATHVHVRAAIVDSLTDLLYKSRSVSVSEAVISVLETKVVPVAAELNERLPVTEERWEVAEQTCEPPTVYSEPGFGPICKALMKAVKLSRRKCMRSHNLVGRLLLPLIRKSRDNNTRWTNIFFRKHGASDLAEMAPCCPAKPQLLEILQCKFADQMPAAEFANLSDILLFAACPPETYRTLASKLKDHPQAYDQQDALHWLRTTDGSQFTAPERNVKGAKGSQEIVTSLKRGRFASSEQAAAHDLVTPAHLQAHERKILDALFANYATDPEAWERHVAVYSPPTNSRNLNERLRWRKFCRPLVQHAISIVNAAAAKDSQNDLQRRPGIVPDVWQLQLWLLPYPKLYPPSEYNERFNDFADQVWELTQYLESSGKPHHKRWPLLTRLILYGPKKDHSAFVLRLGRFANIGGRDLTLAECLCVDLIDGLFWQIKTFDGMTHNRTEYPVQDDARAMCDMLRSWEKCLDQSARRVAAKYIQWAESRVGLGWRTEPEDEDYVDREPDFEDDCSDWGHDL